MPYTYSRVSFRMTLSDLDWYIQWHSIVQSLCDSWLLHITYVTFHFLSHISVGVKQFLIHGRGPPTICHLTYGRAWATSVWHCLLRIYNLTVITEHIDDWVSAAVYFCYHQGKFWKNFGHNEDGKQWLFPEEALYLMDEVSSTPVTKILSFVFVSL